MKIIGIYYDFSIITRRSLKHALAESGVELNDSQMDEMMQAYDSLSTFPDVKPTLEKLKQTPGLKAVVFSNGTHDMVSNSVNKSPDLSPHAAVFDDIVVVEECRKFKPAPEAYNHLASRLGKDPLNAKQMAGIWLISGNPFDVVGGRACGMNSIWVDRAGTGWQDALVMNESGKPTEVVRSLEEVIPIVMRAGGQ